MALSYYCNKCGLPTYYTTIKPIFCSHCKNNFNSSFSSISTKSAAPVKRTEAVIINSEPAEEYKDEDGYYNPVFQVPKINSLEVEIQPIVRRQILGQIAPNLFIKPANKIKSEKVKKSRSKK